MSEPTDNDAAVPKHLSKLDAMAHTQGLDRKPGETDEQLGQRILETAARIGPLPPEIGESEEEVSTLMSEVVYPGDRVIFAVFKGSHAPNGSAELIATATTEAIAEVIQSHVSDGETFIRPIKLYGDRGTIVSSEPHV